MQKTILAFAIPCSFFHAIPAYALDQEGGYLGLRAGMAKNDHSCEAAALECDRDGTGYGIFGGYNFSRRFGIEFGYTDVPDSTAVYPEIRLQGELSAIDLSARYSRNVFGESRMFAKLGATYWQGEIKGWGVKVDGSGFSPAFGIGVAMPFGDRFSARLEYQYFGKVGDSELGHTQPTLLSLGLTWHFAANRAFESSASPATIFTPRPEPENLTADAQTYSDINNDIDINAAEVERASAPLMENSDEESLAGSNADDADIAVDANATDAELEMMSASTPESDAAVANTEENLAAVLEAESDVDADGDMAEEEGAMDVAAVTDESAATVDSIVIDDHSNTALFSKGSSVLKINYALEKIAVDLLRRPHLFVRIEVHTDDQGSREQNQQLATARAVKLADYLKWQGVSSERITVEGKGESHPIADDNIEVGRARSRRAEFFISETRIQR